MSIYLRVNGKELKIYDSAYEGDEDGKNLLIAELSHVIASKTDLDTLKIALNSYRAMIFKEGQDHQIKLVHEALGITSD